MKRHAMILGSLLAAAGAAQAAPQWFWLGNDFTTVIGGEIQLIGAGQPGWGDGDFTEINGAFVDETFGFSFANVGPNGMTSGASILSAMTNASAAVMSASATFDIDLNSGGLENYFFSANVFATFSNNFFLTEDATVRIQFSSATDQPPSFFGEFGSNDGAFLASLAPTDDGTFDMTVDLAAGAYFLYVESGLAYSFSSIGPDTTLDLAAAFSFSATIVPAPGAAAFLGLAGFGHRRRS